MSKKMFFIDLDGTTLKDDKTIPEENIRAISQTVDQGNYVSIATGRALVSAEQVAKQLGMMKKGCFLISFNGGIIYDLNDMSILRNLRLQDDHASYLFREAKRWGLHMQAYSETSILARNESPELTFYAQKTRMEYDIIPDLYERSVFQTPKVLLVSMEDHELLEKFQQEHKSWEEGRCVSFFSCPEYLEYCPLGGTKADAIKIFEEKLGIAHEDTIAVGDEQNDLGMIQMAGIGVAMKNASDEIKKYADYVTEKDNNQGGVAEVIRKFSTLA